jgi:pimeloyl-ACP methyl ester carboxylesterase
MQNKKIEVMNATPWSFAQACRIFWAVFVRSFYENEAKIRKKLIDQEIYPIEEKTLSGLKAGAGESSIIFLHGSPANARKWLWYLQNCPPDYSFFAMDRPGYGVFDHEPMDLHEQSDHVAELIGRQEVNKPLLVGHSYGAPLVMRLAVENPDRYKGVVLLAGSLDAKTEPSHFLQRWADRTPLKWLLPRVLRHANHELMLLPQNLREMEPKLGAMPLPVMIMHARDDDLSSFENVDFANNKLHSARFVRTELLETGGHFIPWTKSEWVLEKILDFESKC